MISTDFISGDDEDAAGFAAEPFDPSFREAAATAEEGVDEEVVEEEEELISDGRVGEGGERESGGQGGRVRDREGRCVDFLILGEASIFCGDPLSKNHK